MIAAALFCVGARLQPCRPRTQVFR